MSNRSAVLTAQVQTQARKEDRPGGSRQLNGGTVGTPLVWSGEPMPWCRRPDRMTKSRPKFRRSFRSSIYVSVLRPPQYSIPYVRNTSCLLWQHPPDSNAPAGTLCGGRRLTQGPASLTSHKLAMDAPVSDDGSTYVIRRHCLTQCCLRERTLPYAPTLYAGAAKTLAITADGPWNILPST